MSRPVGNKTDVEPLELWEYTLIMAKLPAHWQLFYELLWNTGLRLTEALDLTKKDLDATGVWVTRKKRKDKLREHLPLSSAILNKLAERCRYSRAAHIFAFTPQAAWLALHKAAGLARVRETIHPHSFRHGFGRRAVHADLGGLSALEQLARVQRMMGHSRISSTEVYIKPSKGDINESWRRLNK